MKDSGVYTLTIEMAKDQIIKIGKLGNIKFKKGFYTYTGSALNGLTSRINRHKSHDKKLFWHIDYLLNSKNAKISDVLTVKTKNRLECELNEKISKLPGAETAVKKFGCSDCNCKTHLHYFSELDLKKIISLN